MEPEDTLEALMNPEILTDPVDVSFFRPVLDPDVLRDIEEVRSRQEVFFSVIDRLIGVYRDFDRKKRADLKLQMKALYEKLVELGEAVGVARLSVDHLWRG